MNPSAPMILFAGLEPAERTAGTPVSVRLDWTGQPRVGERYEWQRYGQPVPGETSSSTPSDGRDEGLRCLVTIDNGEGTAMAIAAGFEPVPVVPRPSPGTPGGGEFSSDFTSDFRI